jgi:nitrite reductase/ring-hydroxylating ferredoxin subunit
LFGSVRDIARRPVTKPLLGRRLVAYQTESGRVAVLDARCAHLGADLGFGKVVGDHLRCSFHHWEFGPDGHCVHIPACADVPGYACQRSYPVVVRHGLIFLFNGPTPLFPLPFFPGEDPDDFVAARPFGAELDCPWYMVGANAFDAQHFQGAHDRRMIGPPRVESVGPFARRASAPFQIVGTSWRDRLTAWYGGDQVELSVTDWCGNLLYVTATFRRTRSHGMLITRPLDNGRVLAQGVVFVRRHRSLAGRWLLDPLHAEVRRYFVGQFLRADALLGSRGFRYHPHALLPCDAELAAYFRWLAEASA